MQEQLLAALQALQLPLRIKLRNGDALDLGPDPSVTIVINDPTLVTDLIRPSLSLLGSAFVEGRLELEGSIREGVRICDELTLAFGAQDPNQKNATARTGHDKHHDAASIAYHYDLSNAFYQLWLDPDMAYSCAYFKTGEESLEQAQYSKFDYLCRKLRLKANDYLLDVGCGWGGLARFAAREYGARVLGITLSREQLTLAQQRVEAEGLQQRVELQLLDYRDLPADARFDKVVSVGMFEHVGHANLPLYTKRLFDAVKPGGLVLNHGITARHTDGRPVGRGAGEFIGRYVFPNGELPHLVMISTYLSDAGLEITDVESLRLHYAMTLEHWSARLEQRLSEARNLVSERSLRIWRLYLAGCAYAFAKGWINLHQILAVKPLPDGGHALPLTREDLYR